MDQIDNVEVEPLQNAKFVKPHRINYTQNGQAKSWEVISVHPSVAVIIFNTDQKKLVLVKQFRPAVYFSCYSREEREINCTASGPPIASLGSPTKCTATQSISEQSTQHTQTLHQSSASQETQTFQPSAGGDKTGENSPDIRQSSQGSQYNALQYDSRATQSELAELRHQSSQYEGNTKADSTSNTSYRLKKSLPSLPGSLGITLELCAGIVDKRAPLRNIAAEEVLEECGYNVEPESLEQVICCRTDVGSSGAKQAMFYVEVTDAMKVSGGGGLAAEGELIEVVEMTIGEVRSLLQQDSVMAPSGMLFGLMWFLAYKAEK